MGMNGALLDNGIRHAAQRGVYLFAGLWLCGFSVTAQADVPNIGGTYSGTLSGTEDCNGDIEQLSINVTMSLTQSNGGFSGSATFSGNVGSGSFTVTGGEVFPDGTLGASITNGINNSTGATFTGSFGGDFSNNTISNMALGYTNNEGCLGDLTGSLTRSGDEDLFFDPEVTPGSNITNIILTGIQVRSVTNDISSRVGNVLRGMAMGGLRPTATGFYFEDTVGRAAGEGVTGIGLWASYSYSDFEDDFVSTAFSGDSHSVLTGFDISPWESTVFGVALGYENSSIRTRFNRGHMDSDGFTVAPYMGYLFSDFASVDMSVGYSRVNVDQYRTAPGTNDRVTSKPSSDRWFGMVNGNLFRMYGNWILGAHTGLLWAKNDQEGFTESDGTRVASQTNDLVQWNVGGDIGYSWGNFEPFVRAAYELDFSQTTFAVAGARQPANDDDNFLVGAGLRYFNDRGISGNLEWNKRLGRRNFSEDIFMLTLRAEF